MMNLSLVSYFFYQVYGRFFKLGEISAWSFWSITADRAPPKPGEVFSPTASRFNIITNRIRWLVVGDLTKLVAIIVLLCAFPICYTIALTIHN